MIILPKSSYVQNVISVTLKIKESGKGWKTPSSSGATPAKKPSAYRVKILETNKRNELGS